MLEYINIEDYVSEGDEERNADVVLILICPNTHEDMAVKKSFSQTEEFNAPCNGLPVK